MKYFGTKNDKDYGFYEENFDNAIEISDEYWEELLSLQERGRIIVKVGNNVEAINETEYDMVDGEWVKLSDEAANIKKTKAQNGIVAREIENELSLLDRKRIRAIAEPSMKDENTTWLEYYNEQIATLRSQLAQLDL